MDEAFFTRAVAALPEVCFQTPPDLGVVLGSGWGEALVMDHILARVSYADIPGIGASTVQGHAGEFVLYERWGKRIAAFCGRRHWYEGVGWEAVVAPVELLRRMGGKTLLLTNAVGGVNPQLKAGSFVILKDHINTVGINPLLGPHNETGVWGPRFPDMTAIYAPELRTLLRQALQKVAVHTLEGVYAFTSGPVFETPAEVQAYARMGADVVGMSTVPEAVFAHACGLRVAGLAFVSNLASGISPTPLSHAEVMAASNTAKPLMSAVCDAFVEAL